MSLWKRSQSCSGLCPQFPSPGWVSAGRGECWCFWSPKHQNGNADVGLLAANADARCVCLTRSSLQRGCPEGQGWTKLLSVLACVCHHKDFNFVCVMCMFIIHYIIIIHNFASCKVLCVPIFPGPLWDISLQSCRGWSVSSIYQHFLMDADMQKPALT